MRYVLVTPAADFITLAEAKRHLRVDHAEDDALITALISAAIQHIDGRRGILGRAIVTQTWRLETEGPTDGRIEIDMPDVQAISSIAYLSDGIAETWLAAEYRLGYQSDGAFVEALEEFSFPTSDEQEDAYRVTFTAGFGAAAAVPAPIKAAVLLMIGDLYEHRETATVGAQASVIPLTPTVDRLIAPYRVISL